MNLNPEFQRQLFLEYSQARVLGIPAVLGAIFSLAYFVDDNRIGGAVATAAITAYWLIVLLWGARQTVDSITDEYREQTWDIQRLSALGPWQMAWGKLFGSTVMVWYAALLCLLVYSLATDARGNLALALFYDLGAGLLVQSGGLLLGLLAVRRGRYKSSSVLVLALLVFLPVAAKLSNLSDDGYGLHYLGAGYWYGLDIGGNLFHACSLLLAIAWCNVGNVRLLSRELALPTRPWVWLGFNAFLAVYLGGFMPASSYSLAWSALLVCTGLTYTALLAETNDAMQVKRLLDFIRQGDWPRAFREIPLYWLSFLMAVPAAGALMLLEPPWADFSTAFHFYPLPLLLIVLRDCGLYLYFAYGSQPQRAFNLSLLAALLLYGVLPGIFTALGQNSLAAWFFPLWADSAAGSLICAALQVCAVFLLLRQRWQHATSIAVPLPSPK